MAEVTLGDFEGQKIVRTTIKITNTGDGLSKAMQIDPAILHQHDTVYIVLECKVADVSFPPVKNSDTEVERKHQLKAGRATFIDRNAVFDAIEAQAKKIQDARDELSGAMSLDLAADPLDEQCNESSDCPAHPGMKVPHRVKGGIAVPADSPNGDGSVADLDEKREARKAEGTTKKAAPRKATAAKKATPRKTAAKKKGK